MYNNLINSNTTLNTVTDPTKLSRILTGIKSSDVAGMPVTSKISGVVNIMNASAISSVLITGSQVVF